jgi:hypothetical protein
MSMEFPDESPDLPQRVRREIRVARPPVHPREQNALRPAQGAAVDLLDDFAVEGRQRLRHPQPGIVAKRLEPLDLGLNRRAILLVERIDLEYRRPGLDRGVDPGQTRLAGV